MTYRDSNFVPFAAALSMALPILAYLFDRSIQPESLLKFGAWFFIFNMALRGLWASFPDFNGSNYTFFKCLSFGLLFASAVTMLAQLPSPFSALDFNRLLQNFLLLAAGGTVVSYLLDWILEAATGRPSRAY
jgi:hypothetical protein